jgi:hypothetical protein
MRRLRENGLVEAADVATIFSNVDQIRNLNRTLFDSLEGLDKLPTEQSNVGERFLTFVRPPILDSFLSLLLSPKFQFVAPCAW